MGFYSQTFLVFLMKESKKRRPKQLRKLMAKSRSQPVNLPGAWPLMKPLANPPPIELQETWTKCLQGPFSISLEEGKQGRSQKKLMTEAMSMEDL